MNAERPYAHLPASLQKKLKLLDRLNDEWELLPKQDKGRTIRISGENMTYWIHMAGIADFYQLDNVLDSFQEEGLIVSHKSVNPGA